MSKYEVEIPEGFKVKDVVTSGPQVTLCLEEETPTVNLHEVKSVTYDYTGDKITSVTITLHNGCVRTFAGEKNVVKLSREVYWPSYKATSICVKTIEGGEVGCRCRVRSTLLLVEMSHNFGRYDTLKNHLSDTTTNARYGFRRETINCYKFDSSDFIFVIPSEDVVRLVDVSTGKIFAEFTCE